MCRTQCIMALVALYVGLANSSSWDFATAHGQNLEFYFKGRKTHTEKMIGGIDKITYDSVGNRMFFYDFVNKNYSIFSYDLATKETKPLVKKSFWNEMIGGIAFDPVEKLLFWQNHYESRIGWISLNNGFKNNIYGNILLKTFDQGPSTIAIDICRGYIYWTSIDLIGQKLPSLIERARFDGSEREVVIRTGLQMPERLVVDPLTQKLYWTDGTQGINRVPTKDKQFSIISADLNGNNRTVLYRESGLDQPMSLAVSEDSIYWSHVLQSNAWQLPKNPSIHPEPKAIPINTYAEIATNYKIEQQIEGVQDCERLRSLLQNDSPTDGNDSLDVATDINLYDVHTTGDRGVSQCNYKCEQTCSVCQNYCFKGDCSVTDEGEPRCRCNAGYSGQRCEINMCQGYCLNNGDCSLNEEDASVCQCQADYEGDRCEVSSCLNRLNKHFQTVAMLRDVLNADITARNLDRGVKSTCAATVF